MKNKRQKGFSYIEILIAMALFSILIAVALPTLIQAARNMDISQEHYWHHLAAQSIMLAVRDSLLHGGILENAAQSMADAHDVEFYTVSIFGENTISFSSYESPPADILLTSQLAPFMGEVSFVVVAVWNSEGILTGRAVGVAHQGVEP